MTLKAKAATAVGILTVWGIVAVTLPAQLGLVALLSLMALTGYMIYREETK